MCVGQVNKQVTNSIQRIWSQFLEVKTTTYYELTYRTNPNKVLESSSNNIVLALRWSITDVRSYKRLIKRCKCRETIVPVCRWHRRDMALTRKFRSRGIDLSHVRYHPLNYTRAEELGRALFVNKQAVYGSQCNEKNSTIMCIRCRICLTLISKKFVHFEMACYIHPILPFQGCLK